MAPRTTPASGDQRIRKTPNAAANHIERLESDYIECARQERRWTMVRTWLCGVAVAIVAATGLAHAADDAATVIGNASKALGVDTLKTVQYSATGFDFALGQAPNPSAPWPKFINKSYTRAVDFEKGMSRVDRIRVQAEH